jgi:hypothetical protein
MKINELTQQAAEKIADGILKGNSIDVQNIIWQAIELGMRDAYERGKKKGFDLAFLQQNIDNEKLSDAEFRQMIRNIL